MTILWLVAAAVGVQAALWRIQMRTQDASTIDVGWTVLVGAGAIAAGVLVSGDPATRALVSALAAVWAARLGWYLVGDRSRSGVEDGRYRALRDEWGPRAPRNFLLLYLAQVPIAALFIAPLVAAMQRAALDGWMAAGIAVWLASVAGESIADAQLARFRADPANRGRVCQAGLWRYSRHPNYFFEWTHWFTYVLIAHGAAITWIGPVAMLLFLFRVTGIPHTERQALRSRGEAYRAYQRTTSVFVPLPPRAA